jgi:ribosomal protein S18 acetylase RimI-like enzyme
MKVTGFNSIHLDKVTTLHMWAFKDHLNVLLGKRYIRAFLNWFIKADGTVNVVGIDDHENVAGYIVGAPWGYQQHMNKDLLGIAAVEMIKRPWIFFHKKILRSVWLRGKTMLGLNKFIETTREKYSGKIISLVGIGVSEQAMGNGIAGLMMDKFIELAILKNYAYARLSVYRSNDRARRFYEKMGWIPEETNTSVMGYYKKLQ